LFTPITTVIFEGVKLSDSLFPTSSGSTTWTVPGWVDEELVDVVVEEELDVWLFVDVLTVVLVVDDEAVLVVVGVELDEVVVEDAAVEELELVAMVDDCEEVEVEVGDALLVDVLSTSEEVEKALVCAEGDDRVLPMDEVCERGWKKTPAAKAPATRISAIPSIRAMVESRPAVPADFLASILSLISGRLGPYLVAPRRP